ncbi:MAG: TetR/AcrR family transcriptional regulator [Bacteroidota bacterium]|nr:TetR/AcrR family transcriptional regulator [Bacteroidota bacterium]
MPLSTFLNLDPARQKEILNVAFEEFALYPYEMASLSRIVKNLSVAKGSFYRYFENKLDLYIYLIEYATKLKADLVEKELKKPVNNIIDLFNEDFLLKLYFDLEFPIYSGFLYNVMQERNNEELGNITLVTKKKMMNDIKVILKTQQNEGTLKTNINLDVLSYTIVQIQIGIYDYLEIKYKVNFRDNILNKKPIFAIPASEIMLTIKSFTGLLHEGVSKF